MKKEFRNQIRKITALILTAAMVLSMDAPVLANEEELVELISGTYDEAEQAELISETYDETEQVQEISDMPSEEFDEDRELPTRPMTLDATIVDKYNNYPDDCYLKLTAHSYDENDSEKNGDTFGRYIANCHEIRIKTANGDHKDDEGNLVVSSWPLFNYILKDDLIFIIERDSANPKKSTTNYSKRTSLTIDKDADLEAWNYASHNKVKNWSELSYFEAVETLTIKGVENIENISFPQNLTSLKLVNCKFDCTSDIVFPEYLTSLTIEDCQFSGNLDISNCTGLKEFVFKKNKNCKNDTGEISVVGMNSTEKKLTSLEKAIFDESKITEIEFPSLGDGITKNLIFSAKDCTSLAKIDFGGYVLKNGFNNDAKHTQYAPNFSGCTSLDALTVKGIADSENQTININGCIALATFNISYEFTNANNRVTLTATNVDPGDGADVTATFSRTGQNGLYVLKAVEGSYLDKYSKAHPDLFDGSSSSAVSKDAKFILFAQDVQRYYITCDGRSYWAFEFWNDPLHKSKDWRDYESSPIILRVGETIADNTPNFYAADGTIMNDKYTTDKYTVSVEEGKNTDSTGKTIGTIPTDTELQKAGISKNNYHVVSFNAVDRKLPVTALNPGIAYLTVTSNDSTATKAVQKIIVVDPIKSMTLEECDNYSYATWDGSNEGDNSRADTQYFYAKYETQYPSLSKYAYAVPEWTLYKKNSSGTYVKVSDTTGSGIQLYCSPNSSETDSSTGILRNQHYTVILKESTSGDYSIHGRVCNNKTGNTFIDMSNTGENANISKFTVQNFVSYGDQLGYRIDGSYTDYNFTADSVKFEMIKLPGRYSDEKPEIEGNVDECLQLVVDPENSDKYILKFNPDKTPAQIAKFLADKGKDPYVNVVTHLGKTSDPKDIKTYTKRVNLAGLFTVTYDLDGAESVNNNAAKYTIPASWSKTYNGKDLSLKPVSKPGYDFEGWYCEEADEKVTEIPVNKGLGDIHLKATWKEADYEVTFDTNGGEEITTKKIVKYSNAYGDLPTTMRAGCNFIGWYTEKNGGEKIDKDSIVVATSNHTLYAHWEKKYTVSDPKFSVLTGTELTKGSKVSLTCETVSSRIYYTLDGSEPDPENVYSIDNKNAKTYLYDDRISITEPVTIKAVAVRDNYSNSAIVLATYTIKDESNVWDDIIEADRAQFSNNANNVPESIWISGVSNKEYIAANVTFPDLRVYKHKKLLSLNTDYTVKYANNTNIGYATVTVIGKGDYDGTVSKRFEITKCNLGDGNVNNEKVSAPDITLAYNGKLQKGTTVVTYTIDGKAVTLKSGTDFTYEYPGTDKTKADYNADAFLNDGTYTVKIVGKGNYTGIAVFTEKISTTAKLISQMQFQKISAQAATGSALTPDVVISDKNDGNKQLVRGIDYNLQYQNNVLPGKASVIVTGLGAYSGSKIITFAITGINISKATVNGLIEKEYTGDNLYQSGYTLIISPKKDATPVTLTEGTDYSVSYQNNINTGKNKAAIIFTGKGKYTGTLKKAFTITSKGILDADVALPASVKYQKGGSKPEITVTVAGKALDLGKDYTLAYANNKKVNDGSNPDKTPTVTVTGKGNYSGKVLKTFKIVPSGLEEVSMLATDITYARKAGICKPKVTLFDSNGVKLSAGTDYEKTVVYTYATDVIVEHIDKNKVASKEYKYKDANVDLVNDIIPTNSVITATVTGKGNYAGSTKSTTFRFTGASIEKASVNIPAQMYLGTPVELTKDDITVIVNKKTLSNSDYEIVGYSNNNKKGKATVTIHGIGNYGGTKTVKFTIKAKSMNYTVVYDNNNAWMSLNKNAKEATGTMKNSSTAPGAKLAGNSYKRTAYKFAGWNTSEDGSGKRYTNKDVFFLEDLEYGKTVRLYAQWSPVTYSINYNNAVEGKNGVTWNRNIETYTYETEIVFTNPERTGYRFDGWYQDKGFKTRITGIPKNSYGNKTIYAKWIKN